MDLVLDRGTPTARGSIIFRSYDQGVMGGAFGVSLGRMVAFVGKDGLEFDDHREGDLAWRV